MPYFYDATYILVLIGAMLSVLASLNVRRTFNKYSLIRSRSGLTGSQAAKLTCRTGINDVSVKAVRGILQITINRQPNPEATAGDECGFNRAVGVAAHEAGHALQHAKQYAPLQIRSALVPVVNIGSRLAWPIILVGLIVQESWSKTVLNIGVLLFALTTVFALITLPVEFNASKRALKALKGAQVLSKEELRGTRKVLNAAAMTYVAAAAASILSLVRILLLTRSRRRN